MNKITPHPKMAARVKSPSERGTKSLTLLYSSALVNCPIAQPVAKDRSLILLAPLNIKNAPTRNNTIPKVGPAQVSTRPQNSPLTSIGLSATKVKPVVRFALPTRT
jgi:hypothetical protein